MWRWAAKRCVEFIENVKDFRPPSQRTLFRLSRKEDLQHWEVFTDQQYGGHSLATLQLSDDQAHAVFQGECSAQIQAGEYRLKRSGFCGMRTKISDAIDISDFDQLVFRVRGDGNLYLASMRTDNWVVGELQNFDVWQALLHCRNAWR
eukprot:evm.model.scf_945.6 EVM.evm.TU.scf_945.6   scf_945:53517-56178(-)